MTASTPTTGETPGANKLDPIYSKITEIDQVMNDKQAKLL